MIAVTQLRGTDLVEAGRRALAALARRPGYLRGSLARATDDDVAWVLVTEWQNVGSYRRALGNYDVKMQATALFALAADQPAAFEVLVDVAPGGVTVAHRSDRTDQPGHANAGEPDAPRP